MMRRLLRALLPLLLLAVLPCGAATAKPNLILILADDLGYEDLGVQGSVEVKTPHLDALAAGGIRCTQAYISAPVCSPSRAGLLTGRYQNRFGFEFLASEDPLVRDGKVVGLDPEEVTLADRMRELGYVTGCVGKWHLGKDPECLPTVRGFDEFYGTLGQSSYYTPVLFDSRLGSEGRKIGTPGYYVTDDYSQRAVEFVREHRDRPFFLYLPHFAVHKPHDATEKYLSQFPDIDDPVRKAYAAMLSAMDDGIGDLMATLREVGLEEETLVVFLSDNGGTGGSSNRPLFGKKGSTWEGGLRTPMLLHWKGRFPAGRSYTRPVISLDLYPTCLAVAGGEVEEGLDGVNLLPYLDGENTEPPHEQLFWKFGSQWAIRRGHLKLVQAREGRGGTIEIAKVGPVRLFDLKVDPGEQNDLAEERPENVERLTRRWQAWADTLPEPHWEPKPLENPAETAP